MRCKGAVVPEPQTKLHFVTCVNHKEFTKEPLDDSLRSLMAPTLHLYGNAGLEKAASNLLKLFLEKSRGSHPAAFQIVCMRSIPVAADLVQGKMLRNYVDFLNRQSIGELGTRSIGDCFNSVRLLSCIRHKFYVPDVGLHFQASRRPSHLNRSANVELHLVTCFGII